MFQLVDCLKWRVENEIDNVLRVSASTAHSLRCPKILVLTKFPLSAEAYTSC